MSLVRGSTMSKTVARKSAARRCALAALCLAAIAGLAHAAEPSDAEFQTWADQVQSTAIDRHQASGIAIAFVRDGRVAYMKGYGFNDLERKQPVHPTKTPF